MNCYVYIVRCKDNSLYTGVTWNIEKRTHEHNFGKRGAKSLRGKLPIKLVHSEKYRTRKEALMREKEIKGWNRSKKLRLVNNVLALLS